jgi:tRNA1Val (adenine37-N6)-methyltransferase
MDRYPGETVDDFMDGRLRVIQSKGGYRFSIDAILLSQFATVRPGDVVVDMGTGCGVILLVLLLTSPAGRGVGLEIQPDLAGQARRNALLNGFGGSMDVVMGDIRNPPLAEHFADVVICNPPYRRMNSGRVNADHRRAIARHELMASMDDILTAAKGLMKKKGTFATVYPADRMVDVLLRMRHFELEPKRIQLNYPAVDSCAKLALIEATEGGKPGVEVSPPLLGQGGFSIRRPA